MLQIDNLRASVDGTPILNGLSLTVNAGEVHAIMGPNGAGKSTLAYVLGGRPASTYASVDLPEPLGPMIACTSPAGTSSDTPFRIGLSATVAWRFSILNIQTLFFHGVAARRPSQQGDDPAYGEQDRQRSE